MLADLTHFETITYRAALALQFTDSATGQIVTNGMLVRAWAFDPANPQPVRRVEIAEKSQGSAIYGFRILPGLGSYQIGEAVPAGSLAFLVHIEDHLGRFLPQTRRYDLPLAQPAVQAVPLFSAPNRAASTGYATIRGQLLRTTAPAGGPPQVAVIEPASWSRVAFSVPTGNPGDPPASFHGQSDGRGTLQIMVPYPLIASDVLLDEASWTITGEIFHQPAILAADYDLLEQLLPELREDDLLRQRFPPFQATLEAQGTANLFGVVTVIDPETLTYRVIGPTNDKNLDFDLSFGQPLILRSQVDGDPDHPLSEILMQSA